MLRKFKIIATFILYFNGILFSEVCADDSDIRLQNVTAITETTTASTTSKKNNIDKIQLKIYYEALCIDSITFFRRHLTRSLVDKNRLKYVDLKLIPFGKAEIYINPFTNGTEIMCQHGHKECELNAVHACIIERNGLTTNTILILNCMLNGYNNDIDFCSNYYGINVDAAKECYRNRTIIEILTPYSMETNKIGLTFVPTITFNDHFNSQEQYNLRNRFDTELCKRFKDKFGYSIDNNC